MIWKIYRDVDAMFRLRKVVVELHKDQYGLVDRRRMFAGPLFALRLKIKQRRMMRLAEKMLAACKVVA